MKVCKIISIAAAGLAALVAGAADVAVEAGDYSARLGCGAGEPADLGESVFLQRVGAPSWICSAVPWFSLNAEAPFEFAGKSADPSGTGAVWRSGAVEWRSILSKDALMMELTGADELAVKLPAFASGGGERSVFSCSGLWLEVRCRGWVCIYKTDGEIRDTGEYRRCRGRSYRIFEAKGKKKLRFEISISREPDFAPITPHPRLLATQEDFRRQKERLNSTPEGRSALERLLAKADSMLPEPVLERVLTGRRLLSISRKALNRIGTLAFAWKMTADRRYAERAAVEARTVCNFSDWNPSHFLDVGEMAFAVAIARDWLDDALGADDKRLFSKSILLKALTDGDERSLSAGWLHAASNNWNQVCNGGLSAGAAAVREDYPDIAEAVLRRARATLPFAMTSYVDGNFPEGVAYWEYATDYNCLALDIFERQFADAASDLFSLPGFAEQVDYPNLMTGSTGVFFNFSDPYLGMLPQRRSMAACWYLALRFNRMDALEKFERPLFAGGTGPKRMMPLLLLWYRPKPEAALPDVPLCRVAGGDNPVAVMRSGWSRGDWYVGIKAGSPSVSHGHMDVGSFVLERSGVRWAVDLPCEEYNRIEQMKTISLWNLKQESSRWSLFRLNTEGHGTLMIDGAPQAVDGKAEIISRFGKQVSEAAVDMSELYPSAKKAVRTFRLENGVLSVHDELEGLGEGACVSWNMNTLASVAVLGRVLRLSAPDADGAVRFMKMTASADGAVWETEDLGKARTPADTPNAGVTRVRFTLRAPRGGRLSFSVIFETEDGK